MKKFNLLHNSPCLLYNSPCETMFGKQISQASAQIILPMLVERANVRETVSFRTSNRKKSYGKKGAHRQVTRLKQRAIEQARIPEAKAVESVQKAKLIETETKTPWRAPRIKSYLGDASGVVGCITLPFLLFGLSAIAVGYIDAGVFILLFPLMLYGAIGMAIYRG